MKQKKFLTRLLCLVLAVMLAVSLAGCASTSAKIPASAAPTVTEAPAAAEGGEDSTETPEPTAAAPPAETDSPEPSSTPEPSPEPSEEPTPAPTEEPEVQLLDEDGAYTTADDVALYIYQYGKLPGNFITKKEAKKLGWSSGGLDKYAPGKSIGGDRFGNYEKRLPEKEGRTYTECDIDTMGAKSRGAKRIVFSNDGLIFYTEDHYENFVLMFRRGDNEDSNY